MAEKKRFPLSDMGFAKERKKEPEKTKQILPSMRFELELFESDDKRYPEFNYGQLLKAEEKKHKKVKKKEEINGGTNGAPSLNDLEDDDKVLDVARYFESKYGNRKKSDYVDLGAGYDENDSFIDNTDAYDEIVPEEVTTVHGGFYVNSGPLEFKNTDNAAEIIRRTQINNDDKSDDDEEEESSDEDSDENTDSTPKGTNKRILSSSDNEEAEDLRPPKSKPRVNNNNKAYNIVD